MERQYALLWCVRALPGVIDALEKVGPIIRVHLNPETVRLIVLTEDDYLLADAHLATVRTRFQIFNVAVVAPPCRAVRLHFGSPTAARHCF